MTTQSVTGATEPSLGMAGIATRIEHLTGHRPSRSTLWRWHLKGRLKAKRLGSRLYATESAIQAMLAEDEQRNRGGLQSRGIAAAARLESQLREDPPRGKVA